jgi:ABC-type oligopeptide transport system ATPase subunit
MLLIEEETYNLVSDLQHSVNVNIVFIALDLFYILECLETVS